MAKDSVCAMDVDEQQPVAMSGYRGTTCYSCWPGCRRTFEKDPEHYLPAAKQSGGES